MNYVWQMVLLSLLIWTLVMVYFDMCIMGCICLAIWQIRFLSVFTTSFVDCLLNIFNVLLKIKLFSFSYTFWRGFMGWKKILSLIIFPQWAQNNLGKNYNWARKIIVTFSQYSLSFPSPFSHLSLYFISNSSSPEFILA